MILAQIQADLTVAQKAQDKLKVETLRFLLGAIWNLQIEKYPPSSEESKRAQAENKSPITDSDVLSVVVKQVKTHKESIEMFTKGGRKDLVDKESAELVILQSYLPAQMDEAKVREIVEKIVAENPSADFGQTMKLCLAQLRGAVDGGTVSRLVKELKG